MLIREIACVVGTVCTVQNPYYYQCVPGTSAPTPPVTSSTPTPTSTSISGTSTVPAPPAATGFVGVSGQKFTLNGETYPLVGWEFI